MIEPITIKEAKEWLRERVEEGATCPCCTQFAKIYKRKLNSGMSSVLIKIFKMGQDDPDGWVHINKHKIAVAGDWSYLRFWGLIEEKLRTKEDLDKGKRNGGYWRCTVNGKMFVTDQLKVHSHIRIYDNRCLGFLGDMVSIEQCLGKKFSYPELMSR